MSADAWRLDAACRGLPADTFYAERHDQAGLATAKAVCAECPVVAPCLAFAVAHDRHFGLWAGTLPKQRKAMWRAARAAQGADQDEQAGQDEDAASTWLAEHDAEGEQDADSTWLAEHDAEGEQDAGSTWLAEHDAEGEQDADSTWLAEQGDQRDDEAAA